MKHKNLFLIIFSLAMVACKYSGKSTESNATKEQNPPIETQPTDVLTDTASFPQFIPKVIYTYTNTKGQKCDFIDLFIKQKSDFWSSHHLYVITTDTTYVRLLYPRYEDTPDYYAYIGGCPRPFYTLPSPDGKYLYVVTGVHANSNGWISEYQLFQVDCETFDAKYICECAAIEVVNDGFVIAQARLTNEDTVTCTADEIWVMHDEHLDWNGKIISIDEAEYDYKTMEKKYQTREYTLIKGFIPSPHVQ